MATFINFFGSSKPKARAIGPQLLDEASCPPGRENPIPDAPKAGDTHFVKGTPLVGPFPEGMELAMFGFGCYWCSEGVFMNDERVYSTAVGFAGGVTKNPTYREVCSGNTNHNEVLRLVYNPQQISYGDLLTIFWESHDPTKPFQQGNDRGTQYRSGIYYYSEEQKHLAEASKMAYENALRNSGRIGPKTSVVTEIVEAPTFYFAETYHQQYDAKPGNREYCGLRPLGVPCPPKASWLPDGEPAAEAPLPAAGMTETTTTTQAEAAAPTASEAEIPHAPVLEQGLEGGAPPAPPTSESDGATPVEAGAAAALVEGSGNEGEEAAAV